MIHNSVGNKVALQSLGTNLQLAVAGPGERFPKNTTIERPFAVLGRAAECDVSLPNSKVSYRHAYFQQLGGRIFCVDLGSRTGTHWESGQRTSGWLTADETVRIGPFSVKLPESQDSVSPPPLPAGFNPLDRYQDQFGPLPQIEIEFLNGAPDHQTWRVSRMITLVGSSRRCKFRLEDESVSTFHCGLVWSPDGLWVVDLLGKGGTHVGGEPVRFALLKEKQKVKVGRFLMRVHYVDRETSNHTSSEQSSPEKAKRRRPRSAGKAQQASVDHPENAESFAMPEMVAETAAKAVPELTRERTQLAAERQTLDGLKTELESLKAQLAEREQGLNRREDLLAGYENDVVERKQEIEAIRSELERSDSELAAAKHLVQKHCDELQERDEQLKAERSRFDQERFVFEQERRDFAIEREDVAGLKSKLEAELASLAQRQEQLTVQKSHLDQAQKEAEVLAEEYTRTETQLFNQRELLIREREALADEKARWQTDAAEADKRAAEAAKNQSKLSARSSDLNNQLAECERRSEELEKREAEQKRQKQLLDADRQGLDKERAAFLADQERQKLRFDDLNNRELEMEARQLKFSEAQGRLATQWEELHQSQAQLEAERKRIESERDALAAREEQLQDESRSIERQRNEIAARTEELAELKSILKAEREQLAQGKGQILAARRALRHKRAEILSQREELQQRNTVGEDDKTPIADMEYIDPLPEHPLELTRRNKVFKTLQDGDVLVVVPQGDSSQFHYAEIQTEANNARRLLDSGMFTHVVIDFDGAEISSAVIISVIVSLARKAGVRGGRTVLCRMPEKTRSVLKSMKLDAIWPHFDAVDAAVASLAK